MDVTGKVVEILPAVTGTGAKNWKKQDFVIETDGQYPKKICITAWGATCDSVEQLNVGDTVKCFINIESREYGSRWYTDIKLWKFEFVRQTASADEHSADFKPVQEAQANNIPSVPENDLPF